MEINELKIFLAVARQGSISRAAEELHYVQSNVTTRIKQLEGRLGTHLFHRNSKGVCLTSSGRTLLDYAERIVQLTNEARQAFSEEAEPQGVLAIGSMETTAAVRLPNLLADYHRRYPQVELNLITASSAESLNRLLAFEVEAALVAGEVNPQALIAEQAFEEELVVAAPLRENPLDGDYLKILVFRSGCAYRAQLENWLQHSGRLNYQIVELGSIDGIIGCVAAGMGISFLPRSVVERPHYLQVCTLYEVSEPFRSMTTWFVRRRHEKPSKALQAFRDLLLMA